MHHAGSAEAAEAKPFHWTRPIAVGLDALVLRPIGVVHVLAGIVLFVPIGAVAWVGGRQNFEDAYEAFINTPAEFALRRPLGELE